MNSQLVQAVRDIQYLNVTDRTFGQTRSGYNLNDSRMSYIIAKA